MRPILRMAGKPASTATDPHRLLETILHDSRSERWAAVVVHKDLVPAEPRGTWGRVADEVAFALSRLGRTDDAVAILERAQGVEPTWRRASTLAYLFYAALMDAMRGPSSRGHDRRPPSMPERPRRDREADRRRFRHWMAVALALDPGSIKDLYRLGVFESQVESRRDVAAIRAFNRAISAYDALDIETKVRRKDLRKPYHRALYAAARSAFRLGRFEEARRRIFACIREDRETDFVAPVHKLFLAGRVCAELGRVEDAERAYRLALDADGPPRRDFVFAALATLAWRAGRLDDATAWVERHVPAHRRGAAIWRLLGDIRLAAGREDEALAAWENALRKDRAGRHLTLVRIGRRRLAANRLREARRAFQEAIEFRRRRYLSEDRPALEGLRDVAEAGGDSRLRASCDSRLRALDGATGSRDGVRADDRA